MPCAIAVKSDAGRLGHVGERPVAVVAIERAGVPPLLGIARQGAALGHEDVEPAVAVVIDQADAAAHGLDQAELPVGRVEMRDRQPGLGGRRGTEGPRLAQSFGPRRDDRARSGPAAEANAVPTAGTKGESARGPSGDQGGDDDDTGQDQVRGRA